MQEKIRVLFIDQVGQWKELFADPSSELYKTLDLFQTFCDEYVAYFQSSNIAYPIDWLKRKMEDTLMDYWLPLERVASQKGLSIYANELQEANSAAMDLRKSAADLGIATKSPFIYLDKQPVARRYPFTDAFFIGIPYRDAKEEKWSSLAHELGHQIYWNSRFGMPNILKFPLEGKDSIFQKKISNLADKSQVGNRQKEPLSLLITDWFEEIFADTIGTKLLGQVYYESSLVLARSQSKNIDDLSRNDGKHPSPIIRPFISAMALDSKTTLNDLKSEITNALGVSEGFQKIQILLTKKNPKDKDVALDLETVEEGIRIAVHLARELIDNKRIQPFSLENGASSQFFNFKEKIKEIHNKETSEEKLNEALLTPRVLEKFELGPVGYCPSGCGAQLTLYYCAQGHYYYYTP